MDSTSFIPPGIFTRSISMLFIIVGILILAVYLIKRIGKWYGFFV